MMRYLLSLNIRTAIVPSPPFIPEKTASFISLKLISMAGSFLFYSLVSRETVSMWFQELIWMF